MPVGCGVHRPDTILTSYSVGILRNLATVRHNPTAPFPCCPAFNSGCVRRVLTSKVSAFKLQVFCHFCI